MSGGLEMLDRSALRELHEKSRDGSLDTQAQFSEEANDLRNQFLRENRIAIVGGARTPFAKIGKQLAGYSTLDLGKHAVESLVEKMDLDPASIDEIVYGTVIQHPMSSNLAREIVNTSDRLSADTNAHAVSNNCITSVVAIDSVARGIALREIKTGIAGGSESSSNTPITFSKEALDFFKELQSAKGMFKKMALLRKYRPKFAIPVPPKAAEPATGLSMGQHCELSAQELGISRESQDDIAIRSHANAVRARAAGVFDDEIVPIGNVKGDTMIREYSEADLEKIRNMKPSGKFRLPDGLGVSHEYSNEARTLTAPNSTALTDGASAVCLMSESQARAEGREILGFIDGIEFASIEPMDGLLMAPGLALPKLFDRHNLAMGDVDRFEVHEAFGAQVEANRKIWREGWEKTGTNPLGEIPDDKLNVNGGSIAIGHPFAATGGRILHSLVNELRRSGADTGIVSVCAAGGMAAAMLVRRGD